jgi:hypothetical protein
LKTDECIYTISLNSATLFLGVFVDDILCVGSETTIITWFQNQMKKQFTITVQPEVTSFLGMQITRNLNTRCISLSQPGYISALISRFNPDISQSTSTSPITPMSITDMTDPTPIQLTPQQQSNYMQLVGSLLFLSTRSRPDIAFAVNYLSLFMQSATQHHLHLGHKLLKYIWQTKNLCLTFNGQLGLNFSVMVDSSYASHIDRKSHYGISIHMNPNSGSCISISKKSKLLALSSTEAEYIGMYEASKVVLWLRQFLSELGYLPSMPTVLYEDNKSAIQIVLNGNDKGRTKHMDVRYHLVRDLVHNKTIQVKYMPTEDMIADI